MREIIYHKEGDYYIPDLYLAENEYEKNIILKWVGLMNNYKY